MKINKSVAWSFILLVVIASVYRIMPGRPFGFAPQIAMAVFAGAIIKDKKYSFLLPLLSMFISDALYEILFRTGIGSMPGFYTGQATNYILFASMTVFGFMIRNFNVPRIAIAAISAPTTYFLLSNLMVWIGGGGLNRPKTFSGLVLCYQDAVPFYQWSLVASLVFSTILFGAYYLIKNYVAEPQQKIA